MTAFKVSIFISGFVGLGREVASDLISDPYYVKSVTKSLGSFNNLDVNIARKLIDGSNLNQSIADVLMSKSFELDVIVDLNSFVEPARTDIAIKLIEKGFGFLLIKNFDTYKGLVGLDLKDEIPGGGNYRVLTLPYKQLGDGGCENTLVVVMGPNGPKVFNGLTDEAKLAASEYVETIAQFGEELLQGPAQPGSSGSGFYVNVLGGL